MSQFANGEVREDDVLSTAMQLTFAIAFANRSVRRSSVCRLSSLALVYSTQGAELSEIFFAPSNCTVRVKILEKKSTRLVTCKLDGTGV